MAINQWQLRRNDEILGNDQITPNMKKSMTMQNDNDAPLRTLHITPLIGISSIITPLISSNENEVLAVLVEVPVLFIPRNECKAEVQVHNKPFQTFFHLA